MYKLSRIAISVLSYQTEIPEKVNTILEQFIPSDLEKEIEVTKMRGQYRDRIRMHTVSATRKKEVEKLLVHLLNLIDEKDVRRITQSLESYYNPESKSIYLRLDKFKAANSEIVLARGSDVIKVEIKFDIYKNMDISEIWKEQLEKAGVSIA